MSIFLTFIGRDDLANLKLKTPDISRGKPFRIAAVTSDHIEVGTSRGGRIKISDRAFDAVHKYLSDHGAFGETWMGVSDEWLAEVCRHENDGKACLSYILPILCHVGLAELAGTRPNRVRLLTEPPAA